MLKQFLVCGFVIVAASAQADDWEAASAEYNESYLQVESCFATGSTDQEACVIAGIQQCVEDLRTVLEGKDSLSPEEPQCRLTSIVTTSAWSARMNI